MPKQYPPSCSCCFALLTPPPARRPIRPFHPGTCAFTISAPTATTPAGPSTPGMPLRKTLSGARVKWPSPAPTVTESISTSRSIPLKAPRPATLGSLSTTALGDKSRIPDPTSISRLPCTTRRGHHGAHVGHADLRIIARLGQVAGGPSEQRRRRRAHRYLV